MNIATFLLLFVGLIAVDVPLSLAMIASALIYTVANGLDLTFMAIRIYSALDNFILLAIPFFLLTSEIMTRAGLARRLFQFAHSLVGFIPGGLGHVNIVNSVIFSGMSGSAVADAGGIGRLSYQAMVDDGYDRGFSMSVTAASAVIGPIIPPSLPMVVYAMVANESVGRLFFGGVIPGLILAALLMVYVFVISTKRRYPVNARFDIRGIGGNMTASFLPLMTPIILLGGIYFGVVTITEAAILAVLYSCLLGFVVYRSLSLDDFYQSLKSVVRICGPILLLIIGATLFGFVLTVERVSGVLSSGIAAVSEHPTVILILMNLVFLVLGTISDPLVNIMLFVPLFMPLIHAAGIDAVHFGVIVVLNGMIGLITPPVGALLVIVSGFGKISFGKLVKEISPFIIVELIVLAVITVFPSTVMTLPNALFN